MLYRTPHNSFQFTFNQFSHASLLLPQLLSSPSPRVKGMEFGNLKGGVAADMAVRAPVASEDLWGVNGGAGDDLFVDELLDFSNGYSETEEQPPCTEEPPPEKEQGKTKNGSVSYERETEPPPESGCFAGNEDGFGSLHESELCVEEEGLESLEWLSHFVEDSFSDFSLTGKFPFKAAEDGAEEEAPPSPPRFATPVQTKARTKRARTGVRVWPVLPSSSSSSTISSSSSTSSTTTSFSTPSSLIHTVTDGSSLLKKPPTKRQKKKAAESGVAAPPPPRRCSHCGVTKTPQWRAGPLGSKTLCNACGVRFKSGRLLPEYRPACSPTFSSELHSNNHRKVLEMRRKKEVDTAAAGLPPPVQSF